MGLLVLARKGYFYIGVRIDGEPILRAVLFLGAMTWSSRWVGG